MLPIVTRAFIDVFNVFNIAEIRSIEVRPYGKYTDGSSRFGKPRYIYSPRTLRLGLTWRF